jgi:hypothetical protein
MNLVFWVKGENGKLDSKEINSFEEEELTKLKSDFDKYSQGSDPIKGGWYKCKHNGKDTILFVNFDEIVFIVGYV